jgi:hypothetical protein
VDIFTKHLAQDMFSKTQMRLRLQEDSIMGGSHNEIILALEYPETSVDGKVLEHQALMVYHTSPDFSR